MPRYHFSNFIVSPRRRLLVRDGRELPLIPRYFDLLVFLIERRHEALHRRDIFDRVWNERSPLPWDTSNPDPVARMVCVLLSDWAPLTSGEIVHVDGGFHAMAAGVDKAES